MANKFAAIDVRIPRGFVESADDSLTTDGNGNLNVAISGGLSVGSVNTSAAYNSTLPTMTSGTTGPLQCDANGKLLVSGTINASSSATYNAATPTYSDGSANALQADSHGALKTSPRDASGNALGALGNPFRVDPTGTTTQPVSGSVSVSNFPSTQTVSGSVSVSSLPALPSGANAIGSVSVSNLPATQAVSGSVSVSNFPSTQTVSGIVSVSSLPAVPSGTNTIGAVKLTDGSNAATVASLTNAKALNVAIVDASGNQVTSFGGTGPGGTADVQYADATTQTTPTGTVALGRNASNVVHPLLLDSSGNLSVTVSNPQSSVSISNFPGTQAVTGTFWQATQPVSGTVGVSGSVAVTGTFWQATQPVSLASVPTHAVTQSGAWTATQTPATSGGLSALPSNATALTLVKGSAGQLYGYDLYNAGTSAVYLQIFNAATTGAVTLGSTVPVLQIVIPPSSGRNVSYDSGIAFATGIVFAVTTTRTGSTAPATAADLNIFFK